MVVLSLIAMTVAWQRGPQTFETMFLVVSMALTSVAVFSQYENIVRPVQVLKDADRSMYAEKHSNLTIRSGQAGT